MKELPEQKDFNHQAEESSLEAGWVNILANSFPALNNTNYKVYFSGQLVSLIGTWLQIVSQSWLVLHLTTSPFTIGLVAALGTFPTLIFSLFGGVLVDRFIKRKILIYTQFAAMLLAFILGLITVLNIVQLWHIGLLSFLLGVVNAVDSPARQSFVPEIVTKEQLPSAIALNSGAFNAARVIGPSIAGLLIAVVGTGGAFLLNAASYIPVIIALFHLKTPVIFREESVSPLLAIKEGLKYSYNHPIIRVLLLFTGISSVFGWSYTTILPLMAKNEYHLSASGLGYLYAASGLGSVLATIIIATFSKRISPVVFILGGNALFGVAIILFTLANSLQLALPLLFLAGYGLLSQFAMMNTIIQSLVKSHFRGRVMSIYILMFMGLTPLGNFQIGWLSEHFSTRLAIRVGAYIVLLFGAVLWIYRRKITLEFRKYNRV